MFHQEFGDDEGPTKGHTLLIEGADVPDQTGNVHLWTVFFEGLKVMIWGQIGPAGAAIRDNFRKA